MKTLRSLCAWWCLLIAPMAEGRAADAVPAPALSELDVGASFASGREALKARGVELGLTYIGEVFDTVRGGVRRGAAYQGRADLQLDANLAVLAGLDGLSVHTNVYQIHGTGVSRYYVGNLDVVSNIEALPSTRLHELWMEQALFDETLTVRAGKLAADTEFFVSPSASVFINATLGWPTIAASDLPSGGAAFPFATPGVRAKIAMGEASSLMVGLYNGDPARTPRGAVPVDPQSRNRSGTDFSIDGPPFLIAEAAHKYTVGGSGPERTGVVKLGYFHHFGRFDDLRTDTIGLPLAASDSTGIARRWRGEDGYYALVDQTVYREGADSDNGAAAFLRVSGSPSQASLVDVYFDGGIVYKGLLAGRSRDVVGVSFAYGRISGSARAADLDRLRFGGAPGPVRRSEALVELTYQAVVAPGVTVQPDVQYIVSPGGNVRNPRLPGNVRIRNGLVAGIRATIQY